MKRALVKWTRSSEQTYPRGKSADFYSRGIRFVSRPEDWLS